MSKNITIKIVYFLGCRGLLKVKTLNKKPSFTLRKLQKLYFGDHLPHLKNRKYCTLLQVREH